MNFTTKFANNDDFDKVAKSIKDFHAYLQKNSIHIMNTVSSQDAELVYECLTQAENLEKSFELMKGMKGPVDGSDPVIRRAFVGVEECRLRFLISVSKLAERHHIPFAPVPASEGVPFGVRIDLSEDDDNYKQIDSNKDYKISQSAKFEEALNNFVRSEKNH